MASREQESNSTGGDHVASADKQHRGDYRNADKANGADDGNYDDRDREVYDGGYRRGGGGFRGRGRGGSGGGGFRGTGRGGRGGNFRRDRNRGDRRDERDGREHGDRRAANGEHDDRAEQPLSPRANGGDQSGDSPRSQRDERDGDRDDRPRGGRGRRRRGPRRDRRERNSEGGENGEPRDNANGDGEKGERGDRGPRRQGDRGNRGPRQNNPYSRARFTHFLSVPFNTELIRERFLELKKQILEKYGENEQLDYSEELFQSPAKIHLTFGIMNLERDEQMKEAAELLKTVMEEKVRPLLSNNQLNVKVSGIEILENRRKREGEDSTLTRVLYAKITDGGEKLQEIGDLLKQEFAAKGLLEPDDRPLRLHVTLMNTTFRERLHRKKPKYWTLDRPQRFFEAKPLLEEFSDFLFAEKFNIDGVHISSARKYTEEGFYEPLEVVLFDAKAASAATDKQ